MSFSNNELDKVKGNVNKNDGCNNTLRNYNCEP